MSLTVSSPKDITNALTYRPLSSRLPQARPPQQDTAPALPALRRMRTDTLGIAIYVLLAGALFSQFVFLAAFDLF